MHEHHPIAVLCIAAQGDRCLAPLAAYLGGMGHLRLQMAEQVPQDVGRY
jgi:hypothetical protein